MTASELAALLMFATAISFTPGPNNTLSAALAVNFGLQRALRFVVAVPVGWSVLLVACALGLGSAVEAVPALRGAVEAIGVAYLLWLAWQLGHRSVLGDAGAHGLQVGFFKGIALQFVNIKAWLSAFAISAGWIAVEGEIVVRLMLVLPLMMAFGFGSNFSYARIGSLLRRWLSLGRRLVWFNRAMAAVLVVTAGWMAAL